MDLVGQHDKNTPPHGFCKTDGRGYYHCHRHHHDHRHHQTKWFCKTRGRGGYERVHVHTDSKITDVATLKLSSLQCYTPFDFTLYTVLALYTPFGLPRPYHHHHQHHDHHGEVDL